MKNLCVSSTNPFATTYWKPGVFSYRFRKGECEQILTEILCNGNEKSGIWQVIGPHGSGKSTLLHTISLDLRRRGCTTKFVMLNDENRQIPPDFRPDTREPSEKKHDSEKKETSEPFVFFLDGYEQLSWWNQFRLRHFGWTSQQILIWTTHKPVRGIPILYRTAPSFDCFCELVRQLLETPPKHEPFSTYESEQEREKLPPSHQFQRLSFDESFLRNLFEKSNCHFRTAFFRLYDIVSELVRSEPPT
ncbi:MAG: hypothetical protein ACRCUY_13190 [Thermoguttaceae bacterium]